MENIAIELSEFLVLSQANNFTPSNVTVWTVAWNIPLLSTCQKPRIGKVVFHQKAFIGLGSSFH